MDDRQPGLARGGDVVVGRPDEMRERTLFVDDAEPRQLRHEAFRRPRRIAAWVFASSMWVWSPSPVRFLASAVISISASLQRCGPSTPSSSPIRPDPVSSVLSAASIVAKYAPASGGIIPS